MKSQLIGIDEVGRGAWAGPLVVGAVSLTTDIEGVSDSKIISKKNREQLSRLIYLQAEFVGLGWVSPSEIDDLGLTKAMKLACQRALEGAPAKARIIIDGNYNYLPDMEACETMVRGDALVPSIAAASIVAKVARDEYMAKQDKSYFGYGFASNVGYGTKAHISAIRYRGLTPIHRWSYKPIKNFLDSYET